MLKKAVNQQMLGVTLMVANDENLSEQIKKRKEVKYENRR